AAVSGLQGKASDTSQPPWWRVVLAGTHPLDKLLPGPARREAAQRARLKVALGGRGLQASLADLRRGKLPRFMGAHYADAEIKPAGGYSVHNCTLIYLHGFGQRGQRYCNPGLKLPWVKGESGTPCASVSGLRVVLPTSSRLAQPWGELKPSWYVYADKTSNSAGEPTDALGATRSRILCILKEEIARLKGASHRVFLGGYSQGCGVALDTYLREGRQLGLGGFVGAGGWVPCDKDGFTGIDSAIARLIADPVQRLRPLWLMLPTDDAKFVTWQFASASLRRLSGKLPGLGLRKVSGRVHL
ncbi:unnamed protein product, partial [Polarella glacialis]